MTTTRLSLALLFVLPVLTLSAGDAFAYHPIPAFHLESQAGGGARLYYTGSPRWNGQDCGSCHVDAPRKVRFHLSSTPEDIFATGRYQPGQTYRVTIDVTGAEGKGLRTWMLETLDDEDTDVGTYQDVFNGCTTGQGQQRGCLQPSCVFMCKNQLNYRDTCAPGPEGNPICSELVKIPGCGHCGGGDAECTGCVTVDGIVGGVTAVPPWQLEFIAPATGTGAINLYFGGVAGTSDHTSENDDYEMQAHRLCEGTTDCMTDPLSEGEDASDYTPPESAGCSATGTRAPVGFSFLIVLGLAFLRRRGMDRID